MNAKKIVPALLATGLIALTACSASADGKPQAEIKARLSKKLQGREVVSVNSTPMKGI